MTFTGYRWLPALTVLGALAAGLPVQAAPFKCSCHAVLVCGADDCSPAGDNEGPLKQTCKSVTASIDTTSNELSICAFGDCWKGTATATVTGKRSSLWHGEFERNSNPANAKSSIAVVLNDGVGFAQISDESGPMQLSLTCAPGN